jgi:hypothetical protein
VQSKLDLVWSETPLENFPNILTDLARALAVRLGAPAVPAEKEPLVDAVALAQHLARPRAGCAASKEPTASHI